MRKKLKEMIMNEKDYVSFETALALKEAGFNYPCWYYYTKEDAPEGSVWHTTSEDAPVDYNRTVYARCSMPTLWKAQKWLREAKNIDVLVWNCACGYGWEISKAGDEQTRGTTLLMFDGEGEDENSGNWLSYEAALQDGIQKALKLINK